jgi:hypothetical protein
MQITLEIQTSKKFGTECCDPDCEHLVQYTKFPAVFICKFSPGIEIHPDNLGRLKRTSACHYIAGEEVEDRFWSPMKK